MKNLEKLKSVLCDPNGKCCITGSPEDLDIVDAALANLEAEIADLKRQLEREELSSSDIGKWRTSYRAEISILLGKIEEYRQQLAESQAREARLLEILQRVSDAHGYTGKSDVADALALPHDDTALREYRDAAISKFVGEFKRHVGGDGEFWLHELEYFYDNQKAP